MYDMKPLELEWKKYRKKKLIPWYVGILSMIIATIFLIVFSNNKIDFNILNKYFKADKKDFVIAEKSKENIVLLNEALKTLELENKVIEIVEPAVKKEPENLLVDIPILDSDEEVDEEMPKIRKKIHLDIIETSNITAYEDVEKRFLQSHDIDDSLFLAKSYYKKGNYKKAEYWALQTNKIDENMEESLLIFVKSKVKLGQKNEAISILMSYAKKSNSKEAKDLLYLIQNGKL